MNSCKFKKLIIDVYNIRNQSEHISGIIYSATNSTGFSEITDIEGYVNNCSPSMLYLKSKATDNEVDIYDYDIEDYKIKNSQNMIYILLKSKGEVGLMY